MEQNLISAAISAADALAVEPEVRSVGNRQLAGGIVGITPSEVEV